MDWIYFVIIGSFALSITNILDKFLIDKKVDKPIILTIFVRTVSLIPIVLILPFVGFSLPSLEFIGWIALACFLAVVGVIIFYKAIQMEEISRVVPLFQFIPVFTLFLSFILLNEMLGVFDYVGFVVIVIGGLIISAKKLSAILKTQKVYWMVVFCSLLYAFYYVIMKHILTYVDYWSAFIMLWVIQSLIITSFLSSGKIRKEAKSYSKKLDVSGKVVIFLTAITSVIAPMFIYFAVGLGPVTLVKAAGNMSLVFTFLMAVFLTKFFPRIIKEKFDREVTTQKILGILLIIIGILFTQLL